MTKAEGARVRDRTPSGSRKRRMRRRRKTLSRRAVSASLTPNAFIPSVLPVVEYSASTLAASWESTGLGEVEAASLHTTRSNAPHQPSPHFHERAITSLLPRGYSIFAVKSSNAPLLPSLEMRAG